MTKTKLGIILLNMGGPTSIESVRPFLQNLFNDPNIISFGPMNVFRRQLAWYIARKRSGPVGENYAMIGGKSPLAEISAEQAVALEKRLGDMLGDGTDVIVRVGFSYWHPFITEAADAIEAAGCERVVLLPLYPQYSRTTTGSCFHTWGKLSAERGTRLPPAERVDAYPTHPGFIRAVSERIDEAIERIPAAHRDEVTLLFSAHGTPLMDVKAGDPYSGQIRECVDAVMAFRGHDRPHHMSFQSKVGPREWLKPDTIEKTKELAAAGVRHLVVVPIAFTADHIETLHELGIDLREDAAHAGIETFEVTEGLNTSPAYIEALADLVVDRVRGGVASPTP